MLRRLWRAWVFVARKIGHFQSWIVLALVYCIVIAPFALAVRLFSDPLHLRGTRSWHWLPRSPPARLNAARKQF